MNFILGLTETGSRPPFQRNTPLPNNSCLNRDPLAEIRSALFILLILSFKDLILKVAAHDHEKPASVLVLC